MRNKLIEYGFNKTKILKVNNFVLKTRKSKNKINEKFVLYFGRINEAKGIILLLDTAREMSDVMFKIAGNFEDEFIKSIVSQRIINENIKNVEFLGFKDSGELNKLISECLFVVVPSLWYENQPYSILETFASGKTVIAGRIGGIPEIVQDGRDGLLFKPGNKDDFILKIRMLWEKPTLAKKLGQNASRVVDEKYNSEIHYKKIMTIYKNIILK
jgi:glycosyltransferase involved in cell wall biosynthesis